MLLLLQCWFFFFFSTKAFLHVRHDSPHKYYLYKFELCKDWNNFFNTGPYGSENFKALLHLQFRFFFNKAYLQNFQNLNFFQTNLNCNTLLYRCEHSKRYPSYYSFFFLNVPYESHHKSYWHFKISNSIFKKKIDIFLNTEPFGGKNFKMLLPLQLWKCVNRTFTKCFLWQSAQVTY